VCPARVVRTLKSSPVFNYAMRDSVLGGGEMKRVGFLLKVRGEEKEKSGLVLEMVNGSGEA